MALYLWSGTDERGDARSGELDAPGLLEAAEALRAKGIGATTLSRKEALPRAEPLRGLDAFAFFNASLARLASLGIPLPRAVREAASGLRRGRFRQGVERLEAGLKEGRTIEAAAAEAGDALPPYYKWMLRAGTASGDLPGVLSAVSRNAEGLRRATQALGSALAYAAIILAFTGVFAAVFAVLYGPVYEDLYRRFGLEPSLLVRAGFALVRSRLGLVLAGIGIGLGGFFFWKWLFSTASGERALLRLPLLGPILANLRLARFAGSLGALLRARTPLADALPVAIGAAGSRQLDAAAASIAARAAEGAGLEGSLKGAPVLPEPLLAYLALAERGGRLPEAAEELGSLLTEQAAAASDSLYLVLLPASILVAGAFLGALYVAVALPYFRFLEQLGLR